MLKVARSIAEAVTDAVISDGDQLFKFTLTDQVDHNTALGDSDASVSVDIGSLFLAYDQDGDSTSLDGAILVNIQNDVPVVFYPEHAFVLNVINATETLQLEFAGAVGADEIGNVVFNVTNGTGATNSTGDPITSAGSPIYYYVSANGQTLTASTANPLSSPTDAQILAGRVYDLVLDQAGDTYDITVYQPVANIVTVEFPTTSSAPAGNTDAVLFTDFDDEDLDVVFSSTFATMNSNGSGVGIGSQSIGGGEILDIDFIKSGAFGDSVITSPTDYQNVNNITFASVQNNNTNNDADILDQGL